MSHGLNRCNIMLILNGMSNLVWWWTETFFSLPIQHQFNGLLVQLFEQSIQWYRFQQCAAQHNNKDRTFITSERILGLRGPNQPDRKRQHRVKLLNEVMKLLKCNMSQLNRFRKKWWPKSNTETEFNDKLVPEQSWWLKLRRKPAFNSWIF